MMHQVTRLAVCLALLPVPIVARAQIPPAPDFRLGIDDTIVISDPNHEDLEKTLTILPDGTITYPWTGQLAAAGKTPAELGAVIQKELEKTRNNLHIVVTVKEVHSRRARIVGAVRNPNAYDLKASWRVLDLIAVAGGLPTRPTLITGRIIRSGTVIPLDLMEATQHAAEDANPELMPDDLVLLDERDPLQNKVYVMGQVNKPGAYDLGDGGIGLVSLISQAGNTTDSAALTRAYVLRGTTIINLDLRPLVVMGIADEAIRTFHLQAGDVLLIPTLEARYAVMGQVNRPGHYPLSETKSLNALDALSQAGGQTADGDLSHAGIIRTVNGVTTVLPIDIAKMLKTGNLAALPDLHAEDILYIPAKSQRRFEWNSILGPLSALSYLGLRVIR